MSKHQIILFIVINLSISNTMAKDKLSFSTGATYITGKYGSSESTDIYYVPLSLKYKFKKLTFKLTVPYLEKTGSKNVIKDKMSHHKTVTHMGTYFHKILAQAT